MPEKPVNPNKTAKLPEKTVGKCEESSQRPKEYGGPSGKEPTRYGDWERNGRCIDF